MPVINLITILSKYQADLNNNNISMSKILGYRGCVAAYFERLSQNASYTRKSTKFPRVKFCKFREFSNKSRNVTGNTSSRILKKPAKFF